MLRGFCSILWRLSTCWGWLPWRSPVRLSSHCRRGSRGCPSSPCWWLRCTAPWEFVTPSCACMPACCCEGRTSLNCCDTSRVRSPIPLPPSKAPTWLLTGTGGRKWLKVSWGCSRRRSETSSEQQWEELKLWQRLELRGRTDCNSTQNCRKGERQWESRVGAKNSSGPKAAPTMFLAALSDCLIKRWTNLCVLHSDFDKGPKIQTLFPQQVWVWHPAV